MLKLSNITKYYHNKGLIATGISKINLEFKDCEFIAITGESGSGKSTLLNVISGIDLYEEGELYINGEETSHYNEEDYENYRKSYVSNIYQTFNLISSYTVYQNIELVLLMNGFNKKQVHEKILKLINQVNLDKYKNTKVSKLSGGQKQRVAIARALAKETKIIIADEPTGNLDSKSSKEIMEILHNISKDKLVIIVTHNFDQVEPYATRHISMHDGKVITDKKIEKREELKKYKIENKNITKSSLLRLILRNSFNIPMKFILLFLVLFFMTFTITMEHSSIQSQENTYFGSNYKFNFESEKDILIKKVNHSIITPKDINKLKENNIINTYKFTNATWGSYVTSETHDKPWLNDYFTAKKYFIYKDQKLDLGKAPTKDNEIVIAINEDYLVNPEEKINTVIKSQNSTTEFIITGIIFNNKNYYWDECGFYTTKKTNENLFREYQMDINEIILNIGDSKYDLGKNSSYNLVIDSTIKENTIKVNEDLCDNCNKLKKEIILKNEYLENKLEITQIYTYKSQKTTDDKYDEEISNYNIYLNPNDFQKLVSNDIYQLIVTVDQGKNISSVLEFLDEEGYRTIHANELDEIVGSTNIMNLIIKFTSTLLLIVLFFICYFVIRLILKSRNVYYSTIRMLGCNKKIAKNLLLGDLLIVTNIAFVATLVILYINKLGIISVQAFTDANNFLKFTDYIFIYLIINLMSYLIARRYSKKLFKKSAVSTLNEEV